MQSFDAVKLVLDHAPKDLTPVQRLILIQIAHRQPNCLASVAKFCEDTGIKQSKTVSRATKELAARGLIKVKKRFKNSNQYWINVEAFSALKANDALKATNNELKGALTPNLGRATPVKQTSNKQDNKQAFFEFLSYFPNRTVSEDRVYRAWGRALLKVASEDVLISAARASREMLEPDAWLNFEKWKGVDDGDWMLRAL